MSAASGPALTVDTLVAERDAKRQRDHEAAEQLHQRKEEELEAFRKRLDTFQMTEDVIKSGHERLRRAFEAGNSELMISAFPSSFCTDGGRAIINAGAPPINRPTNEELAAREAEPEWLATMPAGVQNVFDYWKANLKPGGFGFSARIINYPDGKPGDVGLFVSWPKSVMDS
jgi:hypothetical protein